MPGRLLPRIAIVILLAIFAASECQMPAQAPAAAQKDPAPPARKEPPAPPQTKPKEHHISASEAQDLFRSVDTILAFVSRASDLPIRNPVKRELASREQVEKYVTERIFEDEEAQRFRRSELVLKKLGLLSRDFDLRQFLVTLLKEQVAGYYDMRTKTVYLLDWLEADAQKPVLAHELTHALQDQNYDLEKWMKQARRDALASAATADLAGKRSTAPELSDQQEVALDEEASGRSAVIEGQGMGVLLDYMLAPSGRSMVDSADIVHAMLQAMGQTGNPIYDGAPLMIRESLMFPYRYGVGFVQELLLSGGKALAYKGALSRPPRTTHEVMEPRAYIKHVPATSLRLPDLSQALGKDYKRFDVGAIGQFDAMVMAKQYAGTRLSDELTPEWRGGLYFSAVQGSSQEAARAYQTQALTASPSAARSDPKDRPAAAATSPPPPFGTSALGLMVMTRWATPKAAQKFAFAYTASLPMRYKRLRKLEVAGPATKGSAADSETLYTTEEGRLSVEVLSDTVLVLESFDAATAARVRETMLAANRAGSSSTTAAVAPPEKAAGEIHDGLGLILRAMSPAVFWRH